MIRYETLFLGKTEMTEDDIAGLERVVDKFVSAAQGKLTSFDKWGKHRLAYSVEKQTHGLYMLARYELPAKGATTALRELDTFMKIKCGEIVLRHVNVHLAKNAPVAYQRPESSDSSRAGSIDAFIKDNKIDNLLSSVDDADGHMMDEQE